jgi:hypothetical protein
MAACRASATRSRRSCAPGGAYLQWTERARLETDPRVHGLHVVVGLLGREATRGREAELPFRPLPDPGDGTWFPETGHTLRHGFRAYWEASGGVAAHGLPISAEFEEAGPDGGPPRTVQYLERSRLEYHAAHAGSPAVVRLGLLGRELYRGQGQPVGLPLGPPLPGRTARTTGPAG